VKNPYENYVIIFDGKRYPADDYQCEDRDVGIMSGFLMFGEDLTIDLPDWETPNEKLNVYNESGSIIGKGQVVPK